MESLRSSSAAISTGTGNGPVDVPDKGSEELSKVEGERDELKQQVKELEKKLEDLKIKSNVTIPCVCGERGRGGGRGREGKGERVIEIGGGGGGGKKRWKERG